MLRRQQWLEFSIFFFLTFQVYSRDVGLELGLFPPGELGLLDVSLE